jgi:hypothetical protein
MDDGVTAPEAVAKYQLIEKPSRVHALDERGIEICGARQPFGHTEWTVYISVRLSPQPHQVIAMTRECAINHVRMIASLFVGQAS